MSMRAVGYLVTSTQVAMLLNSGGMRKAAALLCAADTMTVGAE